MQVAEQAAKELLAALPLLNQLVAAAVRQETGEETTVPQFRVLEHLADGPLTVSELARRRRVSLQAMGEMVQALVERGWVARTPNPADRRQHLLTLTEEGRCRHERAQAQTLASIAPLLARLSPAELAAAQIFLPALRQVLASGDESPG